MVSQNKKMNEKRGKEREKGKGKERKFLGDSSPLCLWGSFVLFLSSATSVLLVTLSLGVLPLWGPSPMRPFKIKIWVFLGFLPLPKKRSVIG